MDLYITEKETGARIGLSLLPEKLKQKGSTKYQSYDFIAVGEVLLPNGTKLLTYSWNSTFPGDGMKNSGCIKKELWRSPKELVGILEDWRRKGSVLVLMLTESWINSEVTLASFTPTIVGGLGNVDYDISFNEYRNPAIRTVAEVQQAAPAQAAVSKVAVRAAPAASTAATYTVVRGDSLWAIAQRKLGNGGRYGEIYSLNKAVIGKDPGSIYAGQVLTMPG